MCLFKALRLLKSLLLLYVIGTNSVTASVDVVGGNFARKLQLAATVKDGGNIPSSANPPSPPPPGDRSNMAPFKPSIAVVVGVLTTLFSVTLLLLLYAKHCKRTDVYNNSGGRAPPSTVRKNSGVDRTVIESLPIFRFGSLRGDKDGLECAVCLNRFESTEVLRLLPKCKHAFHVECVDTWLDAHSTCPLCRYRVDPEDILLLGGDAKILGQHEPLPHPPPASEENQRLESIRRVSGRHSSAGESGPSGGFLQIVLHRNGESWKSHRDSGGDNETRMSTRRSLDSWNLRKTKSEAVSVGCFDREVRKDRLLSTTTDEDRSSSERRRLEHRIVIGGEGGGVGGGGGSRAGFHQRWSDVQPSDLLFLRSEMIMSDSRRLSSRSRSSGSRPSMSRHQLQQNQNHMMPVAVANNDDGQSGRSVINGRSVSEITGLNRFGNTRSGGTNSSYNNHHQQQRQNHQERWHRRELEQRRQAGLVSRWLAWISQSETSQTQQTHPAVA